MPETVTDKLVPLREAISDHLGHGDAVVLGACLEPDIPFAATYEIIRQGIGGLNVIAPISDASTDMLIGAGCVAEVTGAWVGNVSGGLGHNYRRALENGEPGPVTRRVGPVVAGQRDLRPLGYGGPTQGALGHVRPRQRPVRRASNKPTKAGRRPGVSFPPIV